MKLEVVSALDHSGLSIGRYSRRHRTIFTASPYLTFSLEACVEDIPSTSSLDTLQHVECIELSTDERNIAVSSSAVIKIVDVPTGRELRNLTGHTLPVTTISPSNASTYAWFSGSADQTWAQYDIRMHPSKILSARTAEAIRSVATSPGDRYLAIGTDHFVQLFDVRQRQYVQQFSCSGKKLEFNPTEVLISSLGSDNVVRFFCLEKMQMVSASDVFLDPVTATRFDSHVMIAATTEAIQLLTWEPCDILATFPLRSVSKVLDISINGDELDLVCIGETTERLETRTIGFEEILSYSISNEKTASPVDDFLDRSPTDEASSTTPEEPRSPLMSSSTSQSSVPSSPAKSVRASSLKCSGRAKSKDRTSVKSTTLQRKPPSSVKAPKPSTSMSRLNESFDRRTSLKDRSSSEKRLEVAPFGRPKTPTDLPKTINRRRPTDPLKKTAIPKTTLARKASSSPARTAKNLMSLVASTSTTKEGLNGAKHLLDLCRSKRSGLAAYESISNNDRLRAAAYRHLNFQKQWGLQEAKIFVKPLTEDLVHHSKDRRVLSIEALRQIALLVPRISQMANPCFSIGVDVQAEERMESAKKIVKIVKELCSKRDWYYKQLESDEVEKLDGVLAALKRL